MVTGTVCTVTVELDGKYLYRGCVQDLPFQVMNLQRVHSTKNALCNTCKLSFYLDHSELLQLVIVFSCYRDQRSIKAECVSLFSTSSGW